MCIFKVPILIMLILKAERLAILLKISTSNMISTKKLSSKHFNVVSIILAKANYSVISMHISLLSIHYKTIKLVIFSVERSNLMQKHSLKLDTSPRKKINYS